MYNIEMSSSHQAPVMYCFIMSLILCTSSSLCFMLGGYSCSWVIVMMSCFLGGYSCRSLGCIMMSRVFPHWPSSLSVLQGFVLCHLLAFLPDFCPHRYTSFSPNFDFFQMVAGAKGFTRDSHTHTHTHRVDAISEDCEPCGDGPNVSFARRV